MIWLCIIFLAITTLQMLPMINIHAAMRLQMWLLEILRRAERELEQIELEEQIERNKHNDTH